MLLYIIYIIISPLLYLLVHISRLISPKIHQHLLYERKLIKDVKNRIKEINHKKIILFHATSAGEFEQIKPILNKIDKSKFFIIQSFTSPTIYAKEKNNLLFDISCYHPYDFIWSSYLFFKAINPHTYIITRHDVWPTHMIVCQLLKIPCYYINANIHKNSIWSYRLLKSFSQKILSKFQVIFVPSIRIKNLLINIIGNSTHIEVSGDSRFDQIIERKEKNNKNLLPVLYDKTKNIIFGSYDSFDESLILKSLKENFPNGDVDLNKRDTGIILVPHEINHQAINRLIEKLKNQYMTPSILSNPSHTKSQVIIIDKVGILADLYKYAKLAYVGSGFTTGVHSVIEPAVYGCTIGYGPKFELLDEAKEMFESDMSHVLKSKKDLIDFINLINNPNRLYSKNKVINYTIESAGASSKIIKRIGL